MHYMFNVEDAEKYGLEEAIIIYNFKFWIIKNIANNKNNFDGRTWTYNSVNAFTKLFPFWSRRQIDRIIKSLIDKEVLITGNYNKIAYDRTLWYAFKDESLLLNGEIDFTERGKGSPQTGTPIPDINTDKKQDNISSSKKRLIKNEEQFNIFWSKYNKHTGKLNTVKEWNSLTEEQISKVINSLDNYLKARPEKNYRKDPERYIRDEAYLDYQVSEKKKFVDQYNK